MQCTFMGGCMNDLDGQRACTAWHLRGQVRIDNDGVE
jgi:hypothetical protein